VILLPPYDTLCRSGYISFMFVLPKFVLIIVRMSVGLNTGVNSVSAFFPEKKRPELVELRKFGITADCGRCLNCFTSMGLGYAWMTGSSTVSNLAVDMGDSRFRAATFAVWGRLTSKKFWSWAFLSSGTLSRPTMIGSCSWLSQF
jgi:hypothetical protein